MNAARVEDINCTIDGVGKQLKRNVPPPEILACIIAAGTSFGDEDSSDSEEPEDVNYMIPGDDAEQIFEDDLTSQLYSLNFVGRENDCAESCHRSGTSQYPVLIQAMRCIP